MWLAVGVAALGLWASVPASLGAGPPVAAEGVARVGTGSGWTPFDVASGPGRAWVFLQSESSGHVQVAAVRGRAPAIAWRVPLGRAGREAAGSALAVGAGSVWATRVVDSATSELVRLRAGDGRLQARVRLEGEVRDVAVAGGTVYVLLSCPRRPVSGPNVECVGPHSVAVVAAATSSVSRTIPLPGGLGARPVALAIGAGATWVVAFGLPGTSESDAERRTLLRIDPGDAVSAVARSLPDEAAPEFELVNAARTRLAVGAGSVWSVSCCAFTRFPVADPGSGPQIVALGARRVQAVTAGPDGVVALSVRRDRRSVSRTVLAVSPVTGSLTPLVRLPVAPRGMRTLLWDALARRDRWAWIAAPADRAVIRVDLSRAPSGTATPRA